MADGVKHQLTYLLTYCNTSSKVHSSESIKTIDDKNWLHSICLFSPWPVQRTESFCMIFVTPNTFRWRQNEMRGESASTQRGNEMKQVLEMVSPPPPPPPPPHQPPQKKEEEEKKSSYKILVKSTQLFNRNYCRSCSFNLPQAHAKFSLVGVQCCLTSTETVRDGPVCVCVRARAE